MQILNKKHIQYPLYMGIVYGSKIDSTKLFKRLTCAVKHLPVRIELTFEYDPLMAMDKGITKDPTFMLGSSIVVQGLLQTEELEKEIKKFIIKEGDNHVV